MLLEIDYITISVNGYKFLFTKGKNFTPTEALTLLNTKPELFPEFEYCQQIELCKKVEGGFEKVERICEVQEGDIFRLIKLL